MITQHRPAWSALTLLLIVTLILVPCTLIAAEYEPKIGQRGKDVVWVPTPQNLVEKMLDMANVTSNDFLIDLGSGDGRTVIAAAKRGAKALGLEYNPEMVQLSKRNALNEGVAGKARFLQGDIFKVDLSEATVITMFLLPGLNLRLQPKLFELRPGTRIVSNTFDLGDWEADATETVDGNCISYCTAHLWVVPAKIEGRWALSQGEMKLKQEFQKVSGTIKTRTEKLKITEGRLNGESITFTAGGFHYTGKVSGDRMEGTFSSGTTVNGWTATRESGTKERTASRSVR